jgi:hypothetical protein
LTTPFVFLAGRCQHLAGVRCSSKNGQAIGAVRDREREKRGLFARCDARPAPSVLAEPGNQRNGFAVLRCRYGPFGCAVPRLARLRPSRPRDGAAIGAASIMEVHEDEQERKETSRVSISMRGSPIASWPQLGRRRPSLDAAMAFQSTRSGRSDSRPLRHNGLAL